ncbi:MAG: hypothetical protein AABW50_05860 [Nanoarchaeota archaeon]
MKKTNILFVCRYNRFRSKVAEAYFKKINKNKSIHVKSAGLIKGNPRKSIKELKRFRIKLKGPPHGLTSKLMAWQNITIIVADNVPSQVFDKNKKYGKKVIVWKIKDAEKSQTNEKVIAIKQIIKKVDLLVKQLENIK